MTDTPKDKIILPEGISKNEQAVYLQMIEVRGEEYPVYVSKGGWFHILYAKDKVASATSIDDARLKAMKNLKRPTITFDIPFDTFSPDSIRDKMGNRTLSGLKWRRGHITKRHAATRKAMVRWEDRGATEQEDFPSFWANPGVNTWFQPLTNAQKKKMQELYLAKEAADDAWDAFAKPLKLDAEKMVDRIITEEEAK